MIKSYYNQNHCGHATAIWLAIQYIKMLGSLLILLIALLIVCLFD